MATYRKHYDSYTAWCRERGLPELLTFSGMLVTFSGHKVRDGCVFEKRRKRPIGRALLIHRASGHGSMVVSTKRSRPLAAVEATRWRVLESQARLHYQQLDLTSQLNKAVLTSKAKRLTAWCARNRRLYTIETVPSTPVNWIRVEPIEMDSVSPLTNLAMHVTDPEIDDLLSQYICVKTRLSRSWTRVGRINALLADLIGQLAKERFGYGHQAANGVFFSINGRRYPAVFSHHASPGGSGHLWPSPTDRVLDSSEHDNISLL